MPTYRPTNAGHQTKGTLWGGFSPAQLAALTGVFMGAVMLTFVSIIVMKINIWLAVIFIFLLPNTLLLLVIFTLIMGKPKRYLRDWLESRIVGRTTVQLGKISEPSPIDLE
ncbi:hypothetical protein [Termitidicoccus mucosus]